MKISNSKKQLAKIISENGGWRDGAKFSAQDGDGTGSIDFFKSKPHYCAGDKYWRGKYDVGDRIGKSDVTIKNYHQTVLSRDEYFHLYPAPDAISPMDFGVVDDFGRRYGSKPTIEQLAADYRSRKDYAERKQQEADAAKVDADARLAKLVTAGKAIGLVLSVAAPEPELIITDWRDLQVGDEIKVFDFECPEDSAERKKELMGGVCVVMSACDGVVHIERKDNIPKKGLYWNATGVDACEFTFIRRPAKGATNA